MAVAVDRDDNIYVSDCYNQRIRMIYRRTGHVVTLAGGDDAGMADGDASTARFRFPSGLSVDRFARLTVRDSNTSCLRVLRSYLPWRFARILFIGLLKGQVSVLLFSSPMCPTPSASHGPFLSCFPTTLLSHGGFLFNTARLPLNRPRHHTRLQKWRATPRAGAAVPQMGVIGLKEKLAGLAASLRSCRSRVRKVA